MPRIVEHDHDINRRQSEDANHCKQYAKTTTIEAAKFHDRRCRARLSFVDGRRLTSLRRREWRRVVRMRRHAHQTAAAALMTSSAVPSPPPVCCRHLSPTPADARRHSSTGHLEAQNEAPPSMPTSNTMRPDQPQNDAIKIVVRDFRFSSPPRIAMLPRRLLQFRQSSLSSRSSSSSSVCDDRDVALHNDDRWLLAARSTNSSTRRLDSRPANRRRSRRALSLSLSRVAPLTRK